MRELAERFPAMLPARFGTVMPADELMFILSSRRVGLSRALSHVRGRAQMTVRIMETEGREGAVTEGPPLHRSAISRSGRAYLRARAREAAAQRHIRGFEPVRAAVARLVRDERVERRGTVSTVYHLIPRASSERYRQALERALAAAALSAVVSGPWPPYAFAAAE